MKYEISNKLMLMFLIASASIAATFITPAFPEINQRFSNGPHHELCMSIYLFGYLSGIIFHAPISQKIGTERSIQLGLFIAVIATIIEIWSYQNPQHNITPFLISRFFIAYGLSVGLVCGMAQARSNLNDTNLKPFLAQLAIFFKVSIYLSVLLGGYLTTYASVSSILIITLAFALFLFICQSINKTTERSAKNYNKNSNACHTNYELIKHSIAVSISTVIAYSYATFAPIISVNKLHLSPLMFSLINILNMFGIFAGATFYQKIIGKFSDDQTIVSSAVTLGLILSLSIILLGKYPVTIFTTWLFFGIGCSMNLLAGIIYPASSFLCLNTTKKVNLSSSIMNFFKIGVPACLLFIVKGAGGSDFIKLSITIAIPCIFYLVLKIGEYLFYKKLSIGIK